MFLRASLSTNRKFLLLAINYSQKVFIDKNRFCMSSTFKGVSFEHNDHKSNSTLNGLETLLDRLTSHEPIRRERNTRPITNALYLPCFFGLIRNAYK